MADHNVYGSISAIDSVTNALTECDAGNIPFEGVEDAFEAARERGEMGNLLCKSWALLQHLMDAEAEEAFAMRLDAADIDRVQAFLSAFAQTLTKF